MSLISWFGGLLGRGSQAEAPKVEKPEGVPKADHSHVRVVTEDGPLKGLVSVGTSPTTQEAFYVAAQPEMCAPNKALDYAQKKSAKLLSPPEVRHLQSLCDAPALAGIYTKHSELLAQNPETGKPIVIDRNGTQGRLLLPAYPLVLAYDEPKSVSTPAPAAT